MNILEVIVDGLPDICDKCRFCHENEDYEFDCYDFELCLLKAWENKQGSGDYKSHIWDVKNDSMTSWKSVADDDLNSYRNADDFPYKDKRHENCPLIVEAK